MALEGSILQCLEATLSADQGTRVAAELQLSQASEQSETGLALAKIATNQAVEVHLRQSASFALKKYVKEYWSPFNTSYKSVYPTDVKVKDQIRAVVFTGLSDPIRKMRLAISSIVSTIAHSDWPEDWPELMNQLLGLLAAGNTDATHGAMRVLSDFIAVDISEDQLLPVARTMLPMLLNILGSPQTHSPSTRARCIEIFRQSVMTLFTVKDEHPQATRSAVQEILPQWIKAFGVLLSQDLSQDITPDSWEGLSVRIAIFKALQVVLNTFPSTVNKILGSLLSTCTSHLAQLAPYYNAFYLSNSSDDSAPTKVEDESDCECDVSSLASNILDFYVQCSKRKNAKAFLTDGGSAEMGRVIQLAFKYVAMTTDDEESWATNPNAFIANEDDEVISYDSRPAALELVSSFVEEYPASAIAALWNAFRQAIADADAAKAAGDEDWWKGYESALTVVGAVSEDLLSHLKDCAEKGVTPAFSIENVFTSIIPAHVTDASVPFLQGRCFVFASYYAEALPSEMATHYIDAAVQVVGDSDTSIPVRVSAVRALKNFFRFVSASIEPARATQALARLLPLLPHVTEQTLTLVLEAIEAGLKVCGEALDVPALQQLSELLWVSWSGKPEDPLLSACVCDVFKVVGGLNTPAALEVIKGTLFPTAALAMSQVHHDPLSPLAAVATDIVHNVLDGRPTPVGDGLFAPVASALFDLLDTTEDRDVIQSGLRALTVVVRKDVNQLVAWQDATGTNGLARTLSLISKLLAPSDSESGGILVGDLVIHLLRNTGDSLGPLLPEMLGAFVNRLTTAQTATFTQSLILPFAYLIHTQLDNVLALLEGMSVQQSSASAPALRVLLSAWSESSTGFQGFWNQKVSAVALTQLFAAARPSVNEVTVRGDLLITAANANTIMTRAKAKKNPDQFTQIPFPAKALKLLLEEFNSAVDQPDGNAAAEDADSDDEDEEWEDEGAEFASGEKDVQFLSDMLDGDGGLSKYLNDADEEPDPEEDEDLKNDPIYQLNMRAHLAQFFQRIYNEDVNSFRQLAEQHLSSEEKDILARALQAVV